jgi:catechol 2,3-dioxygenase-like lactoylglutathione lyase family enzyme
MVGRLGQVHYGAMPESSGPAFSQLSLVVSDMSAALAFYRRLGLSPDATPGGVHASAKLPGGMLLEWDTAEFAAVWDSGSRGATGGSALLGFAVPSREAVDDLYGELTAAGYRGRQRPYDAFWGVRYAIVDDPDGNGVGLMSPADDERRSWPPEQAPK